VIVSRRWALKRFSPRSDHPGRIHMSSASSARSAANAWITSSSSTRATRGASFRGIFNIITGPGHICHSTRIVRSLAAYSLPLQARLSRSQRSAVYIIAMNVARHDRRARFGVKDRRIFCRCAHMQRSPEYSLRARRRSPRCTDRAQNTYSTIGRRRFQRQIHFEQGQVSPHWLRHAHGSHAIDRGASLPEVQTTLGHGNIATTSGYLHARPDTSSGLHLDPGVFLR
jgi:Phage integrase family